MFHAIFDIFIITSYANLYIPGSVPNSFDLNQTKSVFHNDALFQIQQEELLLMWAKTYVSLKLLFGTRNLINDKKKLNI
jgi:hypothetical protein